MPTDAGLTACPQCGKKFPANVLICPDDGTVLEHVTPAPTQAGQILDGKYRLDALLAEGGMGAVYRATHVMLGKTVAIKLIRAGLVASPEIVRRFQREARAATALNHPNIVTVYDLGQTPDGTLYIAMEFIDGPSLKTVIQSRRAIPAMRTIAILRQVASALAVAHRHNIVHRDLKPHNIMLAHGSDGSEVPKLVDFGIAKTFDEATQLTSAGSALGTPYYMSPEQIDGRNVDARADIYALGIILYEMLVGEVPFADQSTPAVLVKQLKERPVRPSLKNASVPPALEAIALRCLEKEPDQRYQTADDFAAALNDAAGTIEAGAAAADVTLPLPRAATAPPTPASTPLQTDSTLMSPASAASQLAAHAPADDASPSAVSAPSAQSIGAAATPPAAATDVSSAAASSRASIATPSAADTKPTVPQAVVPPAPAAAQPSSSSSSLAPLIAVAAVLLLLAGGYIWWSDRQARAAAGAPIAQADAPNTVPAAAQPPPPPTPPPTDTATPAPPVASGTPSAAVPALPPTSAPSSPPVASNGAGTTATSPTGSNSPASQSAATPTRNAAGAATLGAETAAASSQGAATPSAASASNGGRAAVRGADQGAATASATRESQGAANAPRASVATATKAASAAAANASRTASGSAPAPVGGSAPQSSPSQPAPASTSSRDAAAQPGAAAASIPENAAVMFRCGGAPDVCASLRGAAGDALEKAGFRLVTTPDRADVAVGAIAGVLDQKVSREFGQTFNTRTYQIELTAEAPKLGDSISMPPATTVSFDSAVGRERLEEKSRLIAADLVERIRAFVKKKRGA